MQPPAYQHTLCTTARMLMRTARRWLLWHMQLLHLACYASLQDCRHSCACPALPGGSVITTTKAAHDKYKAATHRSCDCSWYTRCRQIQGHAATVLSRLGTTTARLAKCGRAWLCHTTGWHTNLQTIWPACSRGSRVVHCTGITRQPTTTTANGH
jgi:hypothetical protein